MFSGKSFETNKPKGVNKIAERSGQVTFKSGSPIVLSFFRPLTNSSKLEICDGKNESCAVFDDKVIET